MLNDIIKKIVSQKVGEYVPSNCKTHENISVGIENKWGKWNPPGLCIKNFYIIFYLKTLQDSLNLDKEQKLTRECAKLPE